MQSSNADQFKIVAPLPGEPAPDASCWWPKHHEEAWAAKSSSFTRLTGRIILALQALVLLSVFFTDSLNINIFSIIAGFAILKGSQAWLRFHSFSSAFIAFSVWWTLAPALSMNRPIEFDLIGRTKWLTREDLELWTLGVAFAGVSTMEAAACILCLRTRRLAFWTKTSRKWGGIAIGLTIIGLILFGIELTSESSKLRKLEETYRVELKAIRAELARHRPSGITTVYPGNPTLRSNPEILVVMWDPVKPGSRGTVYTRDRNWSHRSDDPVLRFPHRLPSGEHGHILIYIGENAFPKP
jgi:hypothetical protein